ncbi:hypothetical protein DXG01_014466 [Tephrocybe rancida]|nr:hypothetical protein DXG01_014466 [Tephrocybe rancida]
MASSSTQKGAVTYADTLRSMNAPDVQSDLDSACEQLALTAVRLMENFDYIAKQLHTIDMLGLAPPFKPRWSSLRKVRVDVLSSSYPPTNVLLPGIQRSSLELPQQRDVYIWAVEDVLYDGSTFVGAQLDVKPFA